MTLDQAIALLLGAGFGARALDGRKNALARVGYALVGYDLLKTGITGQGSIFGAQSSGLAKVSSSRAKLKFEERRVRTIAERVAYVHEQMVLGTRDPQVYALAREVVARKCGAEFCIPEKDHKGEMAALFNEARARCRYTLDPVDYDAFQTPGKTLQLASGDCFVKGTVVLKKGHELVPVESLRLGDEIWGLNRWSKVMNTWEKGVLPTWNIQLNNGSAMRLTPDHKVWVWKCKDEHKDARYGGQECSCRLDNRELVRIRVRELKCGMVLPQPERIPFGSEKMDPTRAYVEGLYVSDGSSAHSNTFEIAGQDGCPKEAQKKEVERICAVLGIPTRWYRKYITVKDKIWTQRMKTMGTRAPNKRALSINLEEGGALNLLRGIMADSGKNSQGFGSTFTTTSRQLWLQTRVLLKMAGKTASERYIVDHGGLGENPIWRLGIRGGGPAGNASKLLRVKDVVRDNVEKPCFDIETDDHYVWLPEADWTTSQCDDEVSLLGAMLRSVGIPVRSRIYQTQGNTTWNHINLMAQDPGTGTWHSLDLAAVGKPPGWEVPKQYIIKQRDFDVLEKEVPRLSAALNAVP
ncbi:MAG: hypothetical protein EPN91_08495 [Salinibacterium sp.]|nr:MAG: hypothetical protein EPN91_08495 [Salinibacterium sp.]